MKKRRFPKFLITFLLLGLSAFVVYTLTVAPTLEGFEPWFKSFGQLICEYDTLLIGILLAVNLVELIDILIFAKRDEIINARFVWVTQKRLGVGTMFKQYFPGIFSRAPYLYATEETGSAIPRLIIGFVVTVVKFVFWVIILAAAVGTIIYPEIYEYTMGDGVDANFTLFVLLAAVNCDVFVYALYRILPLHSVRTYKTVTYYSDGSSTTSTTSKSNFIAILILSAIIYLLSCGYYVFWASNKLVRCIETLRFKKFLDKEEYNSCIEDCYY